MEEKENHKEDELNSSQENPSDSLINNPIDMDRIDALMNDLSEDENNQEENTNDENQDIEFSVEDRVHMDENENIEPEDDILELDESGEIMNEVDEIESVKLPTTEKSENKKKSGNEEEEADSKESFFGPSPEDFISSKSEEEASTEPEEIKPEELKKSSKAGMYALITVAGLVIISLLYFAVYPERWLSLKDRIGYAESAEDLTPQTIDDSSRSTLDEYEDVPETTGQVVVEEVVTLPAEDEPLTAAEQSKAKAFSDKWGLKVPCFIISYASLSTEDAARKLKDQLKKDGYNSGYYWIPDYREGDPELFKVYIGPFETRPQAEPVFDKAKAKNKDAYIWKVEVF